MQLAAVVRVEPEMIEKFRGSEFWTNLIKVVSVWDTYAAAMAEAGRLMTINGSKGSVYFAQRTRSAACGDRDEPTRGAAWLFHGVGGRYAAGVFASRDDGAEWIARHQLTGVLTEYEIGDGSYDLALRDGLFRPTKPHHGSPEHVAGFSPSGEHVHFIDGQPS